MSPLNRAPRASLDTRAGNEDRGRSHGASENTTPLLRFGTPPTESSASAVPLAGSSRPRPFSALDGLHTQDSPALFHAGTVHGVQRASSANCNAHDARRRRRHTLSTWTRVHRSRTEDRRPLPSSSHITNPPIQTPGSLTIHLPERRQREADTRRRSRTHDMLERAASETRPSTHPRRIQNPHGQQDPKAPLLTARSTHHFDDTLASQETQPPNTMPKHEARSRPRSRHHPKAGNHTTLEARHVSTATLDRKSVV